METRIKELRLKKGWNQARLAEEVGVDTSYISRLETGKRGRGKAGKGGPTYAIIRSIADALDATPEDLIDAESLRIAQSDEPSVTRISSSDPTKSSENTGTTPDGWFTVTGVGYIGAGALIEPEFEQVPPDGLFSVEVPFSVPEGIVALGVKGDSMLPRYDDGDVILVYEQQQRSMESLLGEEVAVRTTTGRRYLKKLMRGRTKKVFDLESWNATPIENVSIEWIGEIYLTVRSGQLRRIEARERAAKARKSARRAVETQGMDELPLGHRLKSA